jgi:hypothetical protein
LPLYFWHLYVLGLLYRITLRTEPSDRDVRTRSAASRVDLGTRYVTVCVVSFVARRRGGERDNDNKRYTMRYMERGLWGWGVVGKQWTEKERFQQYFYNRYKILHTCHTYCCYTYHFYAYWLYFIYVWHVYVSPKTYKWFGTFIIKDGRYTFLFYLFYWITKIPLALLLFLRRFWVFLSTDRSATLYYVLYVFIRMKFHVGYVLVQLAPARTLRRPRGIQSCAQTMPSPADEASYVYDPFSSCVISSFISVIPVSCVKSVWCWAEEEGCSV